MVEYPKNVVAFPFDKLSDVDKLKMIARNGPPITAEELFLSFVKQNICEAFLIPKHLLEPAHTQRKDSHD